MDPIILASGSPRRQEYFKMMGLPFSILPAVINESLPWITDPVRLTTELAIKKVEKVIDVMKDRPPKWILGADTVIALDAKTINSISDKIFGKANTREEAAAMLRELSGRQHKVVTSIALYAGSTKKIDSKSVTCLVTFAQLKDAEINWYLDTDEWQGVAGAYRIQGLASCLITRIKGSPSTVAGLPLREFYVMLKNNGYPYGA